MEKIALISDIHSNIVALKAVLADIEKRNISRIFCLGDLVLKGSSPCEVVDIIKNKCEVVIKGNCDDYAVHVGDSTNEKATNHRKWYHDILGIERLKYLDSLPMFYDIYISGSYVRMFHATKNDLNYRILDNSTVEEKLKLFESQENKVPDVIIYADIHKQYLQKIYNKTIVNIGSVGNPLEISLFDYSYKKADEITQAQYCIIEGEINSNEGSLSIQFVRVPYNVQEEIKLALVNKAPDFKEYELELIKAKYRGKNNK